MYRTPQEPVKATPLAVDLFSGSGSVSAALKAVGFRVAAALDIDPVAAQTYKANHPEVEFFQTDIRDLAAETLCNKLVGTPVQLLAVCAPCQPFSSQNRKRDNNDSRSMLLLEALRIINAVDPEIVWIENVPGLVNSDVSGQLIKGLKERGYHVSKPQKIDAANLSVPQRRIRFMLVASKDQSIVDRFVAKVTIPKERTSVRQAFVGLSELKAGDRDLIDPLHFARQHAEITIKRLAAIPKNGGSRSALPEHLQLRCHSRLHSNSFPDVYGRMSWDSVAPTLTTGCSDVTRGRFAHPEQDRAISLREAARLQTFPDHYEFFGNHSQIAAQIGNAVPMKMAGEMFKILISPETAEW